jgi:pilus assembly protein Flp/PilA
MFRRCVEVGLAGESNFWLKLLRDIVDAKRSGVLYQFSVLCGTGPSIAVPILGPLDGEQSQKSRRANMLKSLVKLWKDEEGATAVEYGLIVAAIAGLIVVVVWLLGGKVNNALKNVATSMP